jgi:hypothetical protein
VATYEAGSFKTQLASAERLASLARDAQQKVEQELLSKQAC